MGLIKSSKTPDTVVRFSLRDFEAEARQSLERAQTEVEALIAEATARARDIEANAHEQGKADGWREGYNEGRDLGRAEAVEQYSQELRDLLTAFNAATQALESFRGQVEHAAVGDAVELAVAIAERVAKQRGVVDPLVLLHNVQAALNLVAPTGVVRVAIHPSQGATLTEILPQLQSEWPSIQHAEIVEDESIAPGGCRVFTAHGCIDADLQSQLDRIVAKLLPNREGGAA
jgi:flagellar assembly protein FliH